MICWGCNVGHVFPYKYERLYLRSSHEFLEQREDKMGMQKCYLFPLRDVIKAVHFSCNFSFVSEAFLKPNILFLLPFRKEQAYRNWAEISMGVAKPMGHISAQTDTLGEDNVGFWVNGVLERQRMMQALCKHIAFGSCLLSIGKDLRLVLLLAQLNDWFVSYSPTAPGGWSQAVWNQDIRGLSTPQHLSVRGILGLSMNPVFPAPLCTAINLLLTLWRAYVLESFSSWVRFLFGANCFSLESNECSLANILGYVDFWQKLCFSSA